LYGNASRRREGGREQRWTLSEEKFSACAIFLRRQSVQQIFMFGMLDSVKRSSNVGIAS
jgi:hypothetical protein